MKKVARINVQDNTLLVDGDLHFSNITSIYKKSLSCLGKHKTWVIDFSKVNTSDSSGLALILEWIKHAKKSKKSITFEHIPDNLLSIAKLANIDQLL